MWFSWLAIMFIPNTALQVVNGCVQILENVLISLFVREKCTLIAHDEHIYKWTQNIYTK